VRGATANTYPRLLLLHTLAHLLFAQEAPGVARTAPHQASLVVRGIVQLTLFRADRFPLPERGEDVRLAASLIAQPRDLFLVPREQLLRVLVCSVA
jgi:hypothetical protein